MAKIRNQREDNIINLNAYSFCKRGSRLRDTDILYNNNNSQTRRRNRVSHRLHTQSQMTNGKRTGAIVVVFVDRRLPG